MQTIRDTIRAPAAPALLALALALGACSGEGGGGTAHELAAAAPGTGVGDPAAALPANPYVADLAEPAPPVTTSSGLVVSPEFDFRARREVPLVIDVPEARGRTAHLSLCLEWEPGATAGAAPEVDYGSCVLRTTIEDGRLEADLAVASRREAVLAVLWFADPGLAPAYREIRLDGV